MEVTNIKMNAEYNLAVGYSRASERIALRISMWAFRRSVMLYYSGSAGTTLLRKGSTGQNVAEDLDLRQPAVRTWNFLHDKLWH